MQQVILIIGGNIGDKFLLISQAKLLLENKLGGVFQESSIYETEAWGGVSIESYLNQILVFFSDLSPTEVLQIALEIEQSLGRDRKVKWGDRTMDIDILYYGVEVIESPELQIPHPYLHQRRFVLEPLVEIAPELVHPVLQLSTRELLKKCEDKSVVKKLEKKP